MCCCYTSSKRTGFNLRDILLQQGLSQERDESLNRQNIQAQFTMNYSDFQLLVTADKKIRASSEQGEVSGELRLEMNDIMLSLELIELKKTNTNLLKGLGSKLYQALFPSKIHSHLRATIASAEARECNVRLRLIFESPELAALPWELLYDECTNTFLGNNTQTVLSRYIDVPLQKRDLKTATKPLKILLVISSPTNLAKLDTAGEERLIREALEKHINARNIELDVLPEATIRNINQKLREKPYNVFHFIGHGEFKDNKGFIALVDESNKSRLLDEEGFANFFLGDRNLGLIVLNSCRGAEVSSNQVFSGLSPNLVRRGIPAVIAMKYSIFDNTAKLFADEFYRTLALGWPVDAAIQTTRNVISMEVGLDKRDFATPVLYMRSKDGIIMSGFVGCNSEYIESKSNQEFRRFNFEYNQLTSPNFTKPYSSTNLEFPNQSQFSRQQENLPIFSTPSQSTESLEEQQDTKLIVPVPSLPGTQTFEFTTVMVDIQGKEISRRRGQAYYLTEDLGNGVTLEMVYIPGGIFLMGSPESKGKRYSNERPQHLVTVKPFLISKYPITQAQWREVAALSEVRQKLKLRPSRQGGKSHPVTKISWHDAIEFCDRLSQKTGKNYRLPTEAEWEYACRAGTTTPFHFGETIRSDLANYDGTCTYHSEPQGINRAKFIQVGSFTFANAFGLFDMHGNVWEWCIDYWHENYNNAPNTGDGWLDSENNFNRVMRGGSWINEPFRCRSACRQICDVNHRSDNTGLRVVRNL